MTSTAIFTSQEKASLDPMHIPRHVAIIPDGNRRWAKKQEGSSEQGHRAGADALMEIVKAARELGIRALTFYLFSTENWNRSEEEINALMWLLEGFLYDQCAEMQAHQVRLKTIGNLSIFPENILKAIDSTSKATAHCTDIEMILALNYGGRDEIRRAIHRLLDDFNSQKMQKEEVTESLISRYLDTAPWGDPDLLIRTSGELRISNFLLWQLSYTEIYVTNTLWPDFTPRDFLEAIADFQKRDRRLGGT